MASAKPSKDPNNTDVAATAPAADNAVEQNPAPREKDLRALVDELHGSDFAILATGERVAYIQNAHVGFKIDTSTGAVVK